MAIFRRHVLAVFEVEQCPQLRIAPQNDVSTSTSVTTIWSAFVYELFAVEMFAPRPAMARFGVELNVVDEVGGQRILGLRG